MANIQVWDYPSLKGDERRGMDGNETEDTDSQGAGLLFTRANTPADRARLGYLEGLRRVCYPG